MDDSLQLKFALEIRTQSAGIDLPSSRVIMSPTTRSFASIVISSPSRVTMASALSLLAESS